MEKNFIRTTDEKVKEELMAKGYQLIFSDNQSWTFLNDTRKHMSFDDKKVVFTDILNV